MEKLLHFVERYLLVWLLALGVAAFFAPNLPWRPFTGAKSYLPWMIMVTMFAIGCMLPKDELRQVAARWPTVLGGTAIQYLVMPSLAYGLANLL